MASGFHMCINRSIYFLAVIFLFLATSELYAQDCKPSHNSDFKILATCAPVNVTWEMKVYNVAASNVSFVYDWGDGTPPTEVLATFVPGPVSEWRANAIANHTYPQGQGQCTYEAQVFLRIDGVLCSEATAKSSVVVHDVDIYNGGQLAIAPSEYTVCAGNEATVTFQDISHWNCTPPDEENVINNQNRWVQWVYGSLDDPRPRIGNVELGSPISTIVNSPTQVYGDVHLYTGPVEGPGGSESYTVPITVPASAQVGEVFEVTLRVWNKCNPYTDPNSTPVTQTAHIVVVEAPTPNFFIRKSHPNGPVSDKFCPNENIYFRNASSSGASVSWEFIYQDGSPDGVVVSTANGPNHTRQFTQAGQYKAVLRASDNNAAGSCIAEIEKNFEIIESPVPDMTVFVDGTETTDLEFCERPGTPYEFSIENNTSHAGPNVKYTWRLSRNGTSMHTFGPDDIDITDNFTFNITQPGAYKVQLTALDSNTDCANTTEIDINIANNPVADFEIVNAADLCVGREVQFKDLSGFATTPSLPDDEIASWTWYFDYDNNPAFQMTDQNPTYSFLAVGTYKVRLEVTTKYGCVDSKEIEVTVNPIAAAQISVDNNAQCAPFSPVFANQYANSQLPSVTVLKYRWIGYDESNNVVFDEEQLPDPVTSDFPDEFTHEFLYTRTDNQDQLYKVVMQAYAADDNGNEGCVTTSNEINITVNPTASAGLVSDYNPYNSNCTDLEVNFAVDVATQALPFLKTYEWIVTDEDGTEVHRTTNAATNTNFQYTFTSQDSINIKTYRVTLETHSTSGSCIQPARQDIKLNPTPSSKFTSSMSWECENVSLNLDANQKGLSPTNYYWTFLNQNTGNPAHYLNSPALDDNFNLQFERGDADSVIEVTLRTRNFAGCESTGPTQTFLIPQKEDFIVALDTVSSVPKCAPHEITFKNNSTVPAGTIFELRVQRGSMSPVAVPVDGDINDEFSYTFEDSGDYIVTLVGTNNTTSGCTANSYINLTVHPAVKAIFEPSAEKICPGQQLFLNEASQVPSSVSVTRIWTITNLDNNDQIQEYGSKLFHIFDTPGQYEIELVIQSAAGCTNAMKDTIEVEPQPVFNLIYNDTSCDQMFTFEVEVTDPAIDIAFVTWTWGDGQSITTTDLENAHIYLNRNGFIDSDQYTGSVTATATTGCTFTKNFTVNLLQDISANFSMDRSEGCAPFSVVFDDLSLGHSPAQQQWSYREVMSPAGSWTTFSGTHHTFENTTSDTKKFEVRLQSVNDDGCTDEIIKEITVHPQVLADFDVDIIDGCSPMEVKFTNNEIRSGVEYTWDWSDGPNEVTTTETEITHIFENTSFSLPKNYRVRLTATDVNTGCSVFTEKTVTVRPSMSATLTPSVLEGCSPLNISIENNINGIDFHEWQVINLTTGQPAPEYNVTGTRNYTHTLENFDTDSVRYRIIYTGTRNHPSGTVCSVTEVTEVLVYPDITATFTATPILQNLPSSVVTLDNTTPNKPNYNYLWDFGNGTQSTERNPGAIDYGTYGKFTISLTVTDQFGECGHTVTQEVEIEPSLPAVDFEYEPAEGCGPLTVQFISKTQSVEPGTLLWDFGDNSTSKSSEVNPTYTYYEPGEYTVTLTGSNVIGMTATETKSYIINVYDNPRANFRVRQRMPVYMPDSVIFLNESIGAVSYLWDFGDGTTSTEFEPKHAYTKAGEYTIKLIAINALGCADTLVRVGDIEIENQFEVKIPNVFTPNGDQNNDIFLPLLQGAVEYNLLIFNRWGELLFESNSPEVGWDGYYQGVMSPPDAYIYKLEVKFENGERTTKHGDVTLLR